MTARTTLALAAFALAGCHAAPLQEGAPGSRDLVVHRAGQIAPLQRVAIAEFSVESVDTKSRYPGPGAVVLDPATLVPVVHVLGLGVRLTQFPKNLREELPTQLLADTQRRLEEGRIEVSPSSALRASTAYSDYEAQPLVRSSFFRHFDPRGMDTGRPRRSRIYPAEGLGVVTAAAPAQIDERLREELLADGLLRVRLRVGSHNGLATLESGSTLTLTTASGTLTASLPRTLASADIVGSSAGYVPILGFLDKVEREPYRAAIRRLTARFLESALQDALATRSAHEAQVIRAAP
jgi:hypothetical protein